jgi:hypothetical protein
MPGRNRAWDVILRFVNSPDPGSATHPQRRSTDASQRGGTRDLRRGGWLQALVGWIRDEIQDPQRRNERLRRDAMWNERRATRRSLVLLMKLMTSEQRKEFRTCRYFHVTGGSTGEHYRIRVGTIANIDVLRDDGMVKHRLCARPADDVPVYDVMAAQMLHLQDPASEQRFLLQANIQPTLPEDRAGYRTTWVP